MNGGRTGWNHAWGAVRLGSKLTEESYSGISAALKRCSAGWIDSELNEFLIPAPAVGIKIFAVYLHTFDPVESASKLVIGRFGAPVLR